MEDSFKSFLDKSKSILVLLPLKPSFDHVAAGLSLYLTLREEKDIQIYSPSPMTVEFNRLVGINKISQELGNKNLIIEFSDYKATDIERVSYDIKEGQFKLTVIPKQKVSPPSKENVSLSYSGISSDTVIMIGGINESHFPAISNKELVGTNMAHIGVKDIVLSSGKNYVSFSKPASSISEVVSDLIKESGISIDEDIATNLIMGIENTTNYLSDPSVSADTFLIVSDLLRAGGKRSQRFQQQANSFNSQAVIPGYIQSKTNTQTVFGKQDVDQGKNVKDDTTPDDWLEPKIYKGSSIS